jgi:glycosyltransferase involved in cell wall biosynthesis
MDSNFGVKDLGFSSLDPTTKKFLLLETSPNHKPYINDLLNFLRQLWVDLPEGSILLVKNPPSSVIVKQGGSEVTLSEALGKLPRYSSLPRSLSDFQRVALLAKFKIEEFFSHEEAKLLRSLNLSQNTVVLRKPSASCKLPRISILTPASRSKFFTTTAASVLTQSYPNLEWVITDESKDPQIKLIVEAVALEKPSLKIIYKENSTRLGYPGNLKEALKHASGEYVKFIDDDDYISDNCLYDFLAPFEAFGDYVTLVTCSRELIDSDDRTIMYKSPCPFDKITPKDSILNGQDILRHCMIYICNQIGEPSCSLFRLKDVAESFIEFQYKNFVGYIDFVIWLNLLTKGNLFYYAQPMATYRKHSNNTLSVNEWRKVFIVVWHYMALYSQKKFKLLGPLLGTALRSSLNLLLDEMIKAKNSGNEELFKLLAQDYGKIHKRTIKILKKYPLIKPNNYIQGFYVE